jgi:hypothetical protein
MTTNIITMLQTEHLGIPLDIIPGDSLGDKFMFMNMFDWNYVPGCTIDEKFDYINEIREDAFTKQIDTIEYISVIIAENGRRINNCERDPQYSFNGDLRHILQRAVHTHSAAFIRYLMERIIWPFLRGVGLGPYINSFRRPFIEALLYHNQDMLDVLYEYYKPEMDIFFRDEALYHILRTDDPMGYYMCKLYCDIDCTFWNALNKNAPDVAEYIRMRRIVSGHTDPITNKARVIKTLDFARLHKKTKIVRYLDLLRELSDEFHMSRHQ